MNKIYIALLNIGYWFLLFLLIVVLYIASVINSSSGPSIVDFSTLIIGYLFIPSMLSFYGSYFFLFHLYLKKASKLKLLFYSSLLLVLSSVVALIVVNNIIGSHQALWEVGLLSLFLNGFNAFIGFMMHSFVSWFTDIKEKEELGKRTQALELEMIKLKLDPHFLFNTINNIDVLIETESEKASEYIIKLASILRFYLYKSANSTISLSDELKYIQEYIDLQKIRTSNEDYVQLTIQGNSEHKEIPPMLFIPFIENAFKHTLNKKTSRIEIKVLIENEQVRFTCINKVHAVTSIEGGIGNRLIEDRLQLIYGNDYELNSTVSEGNYIVNLILPL